MAQKITIPYLPREWAKSFHQKALEKRYRALLIHRRGGKTTTFINHLIREATTDPQILADRRKLPYKAPQLAEWRVTPRLFGYIAPFYNQAKSIAWDMLKYYASHIPGTQINESELRVDLPGLGRIRLFGADNPQSLRGLKFWEVGFDEYSDIDPNVFKEIVSPACIDTQAPITFMGTIKGEDHLWETFERATGQIDWFTIKLRASESGIIPSEWLEKEKELIGEAKYLQEYELEPMAAVEGAYYVKELRQLEEQNRITSVPHEPLYPVSTYWDLGMDDTMFILFVQKSIEGIRIIDSYWSHGEPFTHIAKMLQEKPYTFDTHYLPHDGRVRSIETGQERYKTLQGLLPGHTVECLPRPKAVMDKIDATRLMLPKCYFDKEKTKYLIQCLKNYKQEFDEKTRRWKDLPVHDWSSHGSDCAAYLALHQKSLVSFSSIQTGNLATIRDEYQFTPDDEFRM